MKRNCTKAQNEVARLNLTQEDLSGLPAEIKVGETLDISGIDPAKLKAIDDDIKQFFSNLIERS